MDMFQEDLLNDGLELIASEIFSGNPKSHVENLKVSLSSNRPVHQFAVSTTLTEISRQILFVLNRRMMPVSLWECFMKTRLGRFCVR